MAVQGIQLFGLIVLSTAIAGAQSTVGKVPSAAPSSAAPKPANPAPAAPLDPAAVSAAAAPVPAPEPPKRPAELPPKPPKVTCNNDQLTIVAENSTLDSILSAVRGCTGAHIDIPGGAGTFRSFEQFGPGPARQVLDELLSGTQYNYVIQSSAANPLKVETVLLTMPSNEKDNPNAPSTELPMTAGRRAWQHMQKFDKPDPSNPDKPMDEAADAAAAENTAPTQAEPPADTSTAAAPAKASDQPAATDAAAPADASAAAAQASAAPVVPPVADPSANGDPSKAVEDRISAMQQMFNQRQQMIQKQNQPQPATPNTPNN
jgi:hypothetical protein